MATTDGVPLFVEELTKLVLQAGLVKERQGRYELVGPLPSLAIPATLHDALLMAHSLLLALHPLGREVTDRGQGTRVR